MSPGPASATEGENRTAVDTLPPVQDSSDRTRRPTADPADRWGDLPLHVREVFRVEGASDIPPRYRDWIDAYYRRLNKDR